MPRPSRRSASRRPADRPPSPREPPAAALRKARAGPADRPRRAGRRRRRAPRGKGHPRARRSQPAPRGPTRSGPSPTSTSRTMRPCARSSAQASMRDPWSFWAVNRAMQSSERLRGADAKGSAGDAPRRPGARRHDAVGNRREPSAAPQLPEQPAPTSRPLHPTRKRRRPRSRPPARRPPPARDR